MLRLLRGNDLRGGDGLPNMALRVVGNVDEQSSHSGGQTTFSDRASFVEIGRREDADTTRPVLERGIQFLKQLWDPRIRVHFSLELPQLCVAQIASLRVG